MIGWIHPCLLEPFENTLLCRCNVLHQNAIRRICYLTICGQQNKKLECGSKENSAHKSISRAN